jgi:hypothetical protein
MVRAGVFDGGATGAAADARLSYRAQITNTSKLTLDYFVDLRVPAITGGPQPAYSLCCSGDSNGGTYEYMRPKGWNAQAAVDLLVDGLPVWSSEQTALDPNDGTSGGPFDELDVAWDQPAGPSTTTLFLGRIAPGGSLTVTMVIRADVNDLAPDCGTQAPGSYLSHTYTLHCFDMSKQIALVNANLPYARGAWSPFRIYAKTPFVLHQIPFHPQVVQPGVQGQGPPKPQAPTKGPPPRGPGH